MARCSSFRSVRYLRLQCQSLDHTCSVRPFSQVAHAGNGATDRVSLPSLAFGFWSARNPISTRIELGCLGLVGVLWLGALSSCRLLPGNEPDLVIFISFPSTSPRSLPRILRIRRLGCGVLLFRRLVGTATTRHAWLQHGNVPRAVPRPGGVLVLQHHPQYV